MMFVDVLQSELDGRLYVGMSTNVPKRLKDHNLGRTKSTKGYRPWRVVHKEEHPDRQAARKKGNIPQEWIWKTMA